MKNRILVAVGGVAVLVVIAVVAVFLFRDDPVEQQEVSTGRPVDVVLDFYDVWLNALRSADTDPYALGLAEAPILGKELRTRLADTARDSADELDPVLCQTTVPEQIRAVPVYEKEDTAQVLITARPVLARQAAVTLNRYGDGWYIAEIECSLGEFAPEREFSFEMEGYLLKSVPPPYKAGQWHLVFEENHVPGHVAPLLFESDSMCVTPEGHESVCSPDEFQEPSKATVRGGMTELGVQVKRLELMDEQ